MHIRPSKAWISVSPPRKAIEVKFSCLEYLPAVRLRTYTKFIPMVLVGACMKPKICGRAQCRRLAWTSSLKNLKASRLKRPFMRPLSQFTCVKDARIAVHTIWLWSAAPFFLYSAFLSLAISLVQFLGLNGFLCCSPPCQTRNSVTRPTL